ncbi:MAG TPA: helix-turn-helix domain-containing protein [Ignavibacteria bacterium]|nr:helix-turn-helix domain-containing protein [Ignavibacteria bacterium]
MDNIFYNQPDEALRLLSVNQVRNLLKISHSKATRLIVSGEIKHLVIEGKIKVPKINVWNYIRTSQNNSEEIYSDSNVKQHLLSIMKGDD